MSGASQSLSIGGLRLRFDGVGPEGLVGPFAAFAEGGEAAPGARFAVEARTPAGPEGQLACDAGIWRLFERDRGPRVEFYAPPLYGYRPVLQADLARDWASGTVVVDPTLCPAPTRASPVATPFGELLLMGLLQRAQGLYVHAAAALWPDGADLFLGRSGAGKSTLSAVAASCGAEVLSDDRTVLRFERGQLVAYGTPFHGTGRRWSARSARVRGLFFLEQAPESSYLPLGRREAAARLASVCFTQFWSKAAVEATLRLAEAAVGLVPTYALRFRPDSSAVRALDAAAHRP